MGIQYLTHKNDNSFPTEYTNHRVYGKILESYLT